MHRFRLSQHDCLEKYIVQFHALHNYEIKKNTNMKKRQINKLNVRRKIVSSREILKPKWHSSIHQP